MKVKQRNKVILKEMWNNMLKRNNKLGKKYLSQSEIEEIKLELLIKEDVKLRKAKVVEK